MTTQHFNRSAQTAWMFFLDSGYSKLVTSISVDTEDELVQSLKFHYTLYRTKAALDQLKSGLSILDVNKAMSTYPDIFKDNFLHTSKLLTAGKPRGL